MRVLIIEDEHRIATYVKRGLEEHGYAVDLSFSGTDALSWLDVVEFDIILLDIMLPEIDGITLCRTLRQKKIHTPVLMLTARDAVDDRVLGLDAGADDYLVKPFAMKELLARMRALLRRAGDLPKSTLLKIDDLVLDTATHQVQRGDKRIELTAKEYAILECLLNEQGRVLTRTVIAEHVWNYESFNESNVVDVYIRNLRRKIDDGFELKLIHTIRGTGYRIAIDESGIA